MVVRSREKADGTRFAADGVGKEMPCVNTAMMKAWRRKSVLVAWSLLLLVVQQWGSVGAQLLPGETVEEACPNAFLYENPICQNNGTLHIGNITAKEKSCSYCDCLDGWGGVDCDRCMSISVCPNKTINGTVVAPTICTGDDLIPTDLESQQERGKVFSCSCGAGDSYTGALCSLQPDTWVEFTIKGPGTDADPAVMTFTEYAGTETIFEEIFPGEHDFYYPVIYAGEANNCKVTRGNCLPVEGTNLGEQECIRYDCNNVQGRCPPEGYEVCDGFPACFNENDEQFQLHLCTAAPASGKSMTITCQDRQINGSYVCYYQQPEEFAPLSMLCAVGSCLYEATEVVEVTEFVAQESPLSTSVQSIVLVVGALLLLLVFILFLLATDWGSARKDSKSCCLSKKRSTGVVGASPDSNDDDGGVGNSRGVSLPIVAAVPVEAQGRAIPSSSREAPEAEEATADRGAGYDRRPTSIGSASTTTGGTSGTVTAATAAAAAAASAGGTAGTMGSSKAADFTTPAVIEWNGLSYAVPKARGGPLGCLTSCRKPDLAVLSDVSGFAGPKKLPLPAGTAKIATAVVPGSLPHASSFSSSLSLAADGSLMGSAMNGMGSPAGPTAVAPSPAVAANEGGGMSVGGYGAGGVAGGQPSTLTGLLGPSGAGKSSLLDILAGRKRSSEGYAVGKVTLTAEGRTTSGVSEIRRMAGYVPQEDVLPGTLSCYEHLMFHARLRMPRKATHADRRERALAVLAELGLLRVADSRIGDEQKRGLSGGEKRRLSIAAELMARPPLLFLDEPTTGLDAATALRVMTLLKGVASRGTTVICSIHQPRPQVFDLLDTVMLLSRGQVAYFGATEDAESYFSAVGRPFPEGPTHPADAMLALCCRGDGGALPMLFQRCGLVENGMYRSYGGSTSAASALVISAVAGTNLGSGNVGGLGSGGGGGGSIVDGLEMDTQASRRDRGSQRKSLSSLAVESGIDPSTIDVEAQGRRGSVGGGVSGLEGGTGLEEERKNKPGLFSRWCCGTKGARHPRTAGFLVQTESLSRRLLLRAVRHPLLLALHFGGAIAMAACLGTIFQGKLKLTFDGAQSRLGVLFFLLLYLSLLSLTSLPVWREDRRLFMTETMGGAYGHLPYFISVALADVLLVRVIPPLAFAVLAYPLMGLNEFADGKWTLFWFAAILILVNVAVALAAMGVGALGLPLDLSNLVGGAMVLLFTLFSRFLLNGSRIPQAWEWLSDVTPLGYAFESLLVNEFNDPLSERPYVIEGSQCSPDLPIIKPLGSMILQAFEFDPSLSTMRSNIGSLAIIALAFSGTSFLLFYIFTRTSPLNVHKDGTPPRIMSRPSSSTYQKPDEKRNSRRFSFSRDEGLGMPGPDNGALNSSVAGRRPSSQGSDRSVRDVAAADDDRLQPILLSWESIGFSVPDGMSCCSSGKRRAIAGSSRNDLPGATGSSNNYGLTVLESVSGYAGPTALGDDGVDTSSASRDLKKRHSSFHVSDGLDTAEIEANMAERKHDKGEEKEASSGRGSGLLAGSGGGSAWSGSITAIMGPSGAGKTTLLNVLAGRHVGRSSFVTGSVRLNGVEADAATVRGLSGYVTQEDVLPETLTCYEHLMFHAKLRMSKREGKAASSKRDMKKRVLEVLRSLNLQEVKDSRIGGGLSRGISGGEKRRLSIATELLTYPGLLFLDEPTTGLDSSTALTTMLLLSKVANTGTTIVCSLHQPRPRVFRLLDRVLLMSRGQVAYFGPPSAASDHFVSIGRPLPVSGGHGRGIGWADAMLDVIGAGEIEADNVEAELGQAEAENMLVVMPREALVDEVLRAEAAAPAPLDLNQSRGGSMCCQSKTRTPPLLTQLRALSGRALLNVARDPYLAGLHLVLTPVAGVLAGSMFDDLRTLNQETAGIQGRLGALFFILLFFGFLCLTSLAAWVKQMALFRHERTSGAYGAAAHLVTSYLADALLCRIIPPILFAIPMRPLAGLRYGSLLKLCGGLVVYNLALAAVLAACGAGAKSAQEALAMGCLVLLFSSLLSGYLVARDDLPALWSALVWISPVAHGFEALMINEFSEYGEIFQLSIEINGSPARSEPLSGNSVLSCFGFEENRYGPDLGLLAAIGGAGLLLAYVLLKWA